MHCRNRANSWDTELKDDDKPNTHVHTKYMNNYNPNEHTKDIKQLDRSDSRSRRKSLFVFAARKHFCHLVLDLHCVYLCKVME